MKLLTGGNPQIAKADGRSMVNKEEILKMWNLLFCASAFLLWSCTAANKDSSSTAVDNKTTVDSSYTTSKTEPAFSKDELADAYTCAIAEYIKAMYKQDQSVVDTLFINKHPDFPDIQLPAVIEKTNILLITYEELVKKLNYRESLVFLNVIGWVEKEKSNFIIVTFLEEGKPQHNCHVYFTNRDGMNKLVLDSLRFEYPYPAKKVN